MWVTRFLSRSQSFIIIVCQPNWQRQQTSAMSRQEATQDYKKVFTRCQVLVLIIIYSPIGREGGKGGRRGSPSISRWNGAVQLAQVTNSSTTSAQNSYTCTTRGSRLRLYLGQWLCHLVGYCLLLFLLLLLLLPLSTVSAWVFHAFFISFICLG